MPLISSRRNTTALTAKGLAAFEADVAAGSFLRVTQPDPEALAVLAPFKAQVDVLKAQYGGADITAPLVGTKQSGNGFDRSLAAIEKYQKRKTAWIRLA